MRAGEARGASARSAPTSSTVAPYLADRVGELRTRGTTVKTADGDRGPVATWWHRPGLLCIGDAAHAMSPVGGVGINLAIQDAVAAANRLAGPLLAGRLAEADLAKVQARRSLPTRLTQAVQRLIQDRIIAPVLDGGDARLRPPLALRLLHRLPWLQRIPARIVGLGFRPEHPLPVDRPQTPL